MGDGFKRLEINNKQDGVSAVCGERESNLRISADDKVIP